jgi:ribosome-associated protein
MAQADPQQFAIDVARIAADHQTLEVVVLDLRGISPVADFFVIGSGTSDRQMRAVFDAVQDHAAQTGDRPFGKAGYESATWMLLDYVDVVIHLFSPKCREYYDLELLWGDAPRVEWARPATA